MEYVKCMTQSTDKVDSRLIELYRIRKAHQQGIMLGFKNPSAGRMRNIGKIDFTTIIKDDLMIPLS